MTRGHLIYSIVATVWAVVIGAWSLLPDMMGLPEAVLLLAPVPAVLALFWDWRSLSSLPPRSVPVWARLVWWVGLVGAVMLVVTVGGHYSSGDTRAELARFAPGWAFVGVWFGYNALLCAWAKLREAQGLAPAAPAS
ncbi:hypothetical protein [Catellatospora sp. NPDC049609]|uniref:hypothetical protein n=1 Tax=Catellatospora sp. NPDC049609 TaxID=3155505 RepID=UPI003446F91C